MESIVNRITATVRDIAPENLSSTHVIREVKKNLDAELAKKQWKKVGLRGWLAFAEGETLIIRRIVQGRPVGLPCCV